MVRINTKLNGSDFELSSASEILTFWGNFLVRITTKLIGSDFELSSASEISNFWGACMDQDHYQMNW